MYRELDLNKVSMFTLPKMQIPGKTMAKIKRITSPKDYSEDKDYQIWLRYKAGDPNALNDFLVSFKGMIMQFTLKNTNVLSKQVVEAKLKKYAKEALDTYKPDKGTKLATHVYNYLQQINRDNYKNQQAIRLPENLATGYSRFMKAKEQLLELHGREGTPEELAQKLNWTVEQVNNAEKKYHIELVEGKQEFDAGILDTDITASAIRFAHHEMSPDEKFLFEHKTGYLGKKVLPMGVIRDKLKYTPHKFNQLSNSVGDKLSNSINVLNQMN